MIFHLFQKARQVVRIVGEVGVHFEDIIKHVIEGKAKTRHVSRAKPHLARPLDEMETWFVRLALFDEWRGAIRRIVIHHKNFESGNIELKNPADQLLNIACFIEGGYHHQRALVLVSWQRGFSFVLRLGDLPNQT